MSDEPTERDVEAAAYPIHEAECTAYTHEGRNARCHRAARAVLASDWYAERIARASREGAAEVTARVEAVCDAPDFTMRPYLNPDARGTDYVETARVRAALRGDA